MDGGKKNEVLVRDPDRQVSRFHCEVHKRGNNCYPHRSRQFEWDLSAQPAMQPGVAAKLSDGDKFILACSAAAFELHVERQLRSD